MRLWHLFEKRAKGKSEERDEREGAEGAPIYSGMRVEVTTAEGQLLFVAKLMGLCGDKAELHQYSEMEIPEEQEAFCVNIRGYNDHNRKAVYMEGRIAPLPRHIWRVEGLTVTRVGNDRAFFRLSTNRNATATMFSGLEIGEKPCKMLNISAGGACILSKHCYHMGDKFLLKVQLMEDRPESAMFCQVLRIIEKDNALWEYGCRFLELSEETQDKIVQSIFAAERQKRQS